MVELDVDVVAFPKAMFMSFLLDRIPDLPLISGITHKFLIIKS